MQLEQEQTIGLESTLEHRTKVSSIKLTAFQNYSPNYHLSSKMGDCPEALNWSPTLGISHPCAGEDFIAWVGQWDRLALQVPNRGRESINIWF